MQTVETHLMEPARIADAVAGIVQNGGLAIFPTDTVYGIGCDPWRADAVERIYRAKGRPADRPLSLHFATVEELLEYVAGNELAAEAARAFLPGPLTIVARRPSFVGQWVTPGRSTIGLRVPKHHLCATILERCGPLAATSANRSGEPAFVGAGIASALPEADMRVDDGPVPLGIESTVVDVSEKNVRLIREGAIDVKSLEAALGRTVLRDEAPR